MSALARDERSHSWKFARCINCKLLFHHTTPASYSFLLWRARCSSQFTTRCESAVNYQDSCSRLDLMRAKHIYLAQKHIRARAAGWKGQADRHYVQKGLALNHHGTARVRAVIPLGCENKLSIWRFHFCFLRPRANPAPFLFLGSAIYFFYIFLVHLSLSVWESVQVSVCDSRWQIHLRLMR